MVEISLHKLITKPLNTHSDFTSGIGLVPVYMQHDRLNAPVSWQPTFLALAVQSGLLLYVQYTFERKIDKRSLRERPLLHYSVLPVPESLFRRGTNPFIKSPKMVQLLAQLGANVHCNFEGLTALTFAFRAFMRDRFSQDQLRMLGTRLKLSSNAEEPVLWGL
jgi:threonine synthase